MEKSHMQISCNGVTGSILSELYSQLQINTNYSYGYHIIKMRDTTIHEFVLTLNKKKRVLKRDAYGVMCFVKGFLIGKDISLYHVDWVS